MTASPTRRSRSAWHWRCPATDGAGLRRHGTGTAGPVNIALPTAVATAYVAIKHIFPDLPANAGVMRPIEVRVPEGSLLSAEFPAPVGGYTETILRMIDVIFSAASQAAPGRVVANAYGTINALSLAGKRANGQRWVMFSFFGGGHGGSIESDGLNHGNAPISTATIPPMEILEAAYPVMFRQWALRPDSAGAGAHRGGLGAVYEIELLEEQARPSSSGSADASRPRAWPAARRGR
jgi:N-methylhydantoinase B